MREKLKEKYSQVVDVKNPEFRISWVNGELERVSRRHPHGRLLDVGAGEGPYRQLIQRLDLEYTSHDFASYMPDLGMPGLQEQSWNYPDHDFVCDVVQLPQRSDSSVVLCTEVLEHVPDPVEALKVMVGACKPSGQIIVTVPLISLMHQAPYWYSSGLSPFWFLHWSEELCLEVESLVVFGDYGDLLAQEVARVVAAKNVPRGTSRVVSNVIRRACKSIPAAIRSSGGFGVLFSARKGVQ